MCEFNFPNLCGKNIPVWITYLSSSAKISKRSNSVLVRGGIQEQEKPTRMPVCGFPGLKDTYVNTRRTCTWKLSVRNDNNAEHAFFKQGRFGKQNPTIKLKSQLNPGLHQYN